MNIKNYTLFLLILFCFCISCGDNLTSNDAGGPVIVIEAGEILATSTINADSESTITIINHDDAPHTITSASALDAFDNSGDFDVLVPASGNALLTLPEAVSGDEFFFYCRFHTEAMSPASGVIIIN